MTMDVLGDLDLQCGEPKVARYRTYPEVPKRLSPRPYLHPVRTLAGALVTEERPEDHLHHLGVGVAIPDVEGHNFWGGTTYVPGRGPTELDNHGTQVHTGYSLRDEDGFVEELDWTTGGGQVLLREHRTVAAVRLGPGAWVLDFTFSLLNATGSPLSFGSPQTNGRSGAAYGGFFWRAPKEAIAPRVFTAQAEGEVEVHGTRADWVAFTGSTWSLVFAAGTDRTRKDPWFVRAAGYPGVGSSLAFDERLPLGAGKTLVRRILTVVADGRLDKDAAAELVHEATEAVGR